MEQRFCFLRIFFKCFGEFLVNVCFPRFLVCFFDVVLGFPRFPFAEVVLMFLGVLIVSDVC